MRDGTKFNVGWTAMCIGLLWTLRVMLPLFFLTTFFFLATFQYTKAGLPSGTRSNYDPWLETLFFGLTTIWLCLAAFWSRALTAFTAPDEGAKTYEDSPIPYYLGAAGVVILEFLMVIAMTMSPSLRKWPMLLETFSFQAFTLLGGMAIGLTYGKTFGKNQKGRESGLWPWLLQKTRSATAGRGFRGPRRYSL